MIGFDTNVLVRAFVQDDPKQSPIAARLLLACSSARPAFVSKVTLCELAWVLRRGFGFPRERVLDVMQRLLDTEGLCLEDEAHVARALAGALTGGAGFADRLIAEVHAAAGVTETLTFDKAASKLDGWRRLR